MAVYSTLLAAGVYGGGDNAVVYTAPPLKTVVVRDVTVASSDGSTGGLSVQVLSGGVYTTLYRVRVADSGVSYQWQGRDVLLPGDQIVLSNPIESSVSYRISGYVLGG